MYDFLAQIKSAMVTVPMHVQPLHTVEQRRLCTRHHMHHRFAYTHPHNPVNLLIKDSLTYRPSSQGWAPRVLPFLYLFIICYSLSVNVCVCLGGFRFLSFSSYPYLRCYKHVFSCTTIAYCGAEKVVHTSSHAP